MVVDEHDRRRRQFERAADHLARIDRRVIDGARALHLVGDQAVLLVEEQRKISRFSNAIDVRQ